MSAVSKPLFRDPVFDGAADPTVIWNRLTSEWWMFYTNRRAWSPPSRDVAWVHGTDIGVAVSVDGGASWTYRGVVDGLDTTPGRHTYWAPEIIDDGTTFHMFVSVIDGVPTQWAGHARRIRHYASTDLITWEFDSTLVLSSDRVIDACIHPLPSGGYRMWYKDEQADSHTFSADSESLDDWTIRGPVISDVPHEGPNVFELGGSFWMLTDEWAGLRVHRSNDLDAWQRQGLILSESGSGEDDEGFGLHADVVVVGSDAFVFYFTHPGRRAGSVSLDVPYEERRSAIQVARAGLVDGRLVCDRDEILPGPILPIIGPSAN